MQNTMRNLLQLCREESAGVWCYCESKVAAVADVHSAVNRRLRLDHH